MKLPPYEKHSNYGVVTLRYALFALFIVVIALFQASLLEGLKIFGAKPDLLLAVVITLALLCGRRDALVFSILAGFMRDALSIRQYGFSILAYPLLSWGIFAFSRKILLDTAVRRMVFTGMLVFARDIASCLFLRLCGRNLAWGIFFRISIIETLYTAAAIPALFYAVQKMQALAIPGKVFAFPLWRKKPFPGRFP